MGCSFIPRCLVTLSSKKTIQHKKLFFPVISYSYFNNHDMDRSSSRGWGYGEKTSAVGFSEQMWGDGSLWTAELWKMNYRESPPGVDKLWILLLTLIYT
jgi:hypothetical protein